MFVSLTWTFSNLAIYKGLREARDNRGAGIFEKGAPEENGVITRASSVWEQGSQEIASIALGEGCGD